MPRSVLVVALLAAACVVGVLAVAHGNDDDQFLIEPPSDDDYDPDFYPLDINYEGVPALLVPLLDPDPVEPYLAHPDGEFAAEWRRLGPIPGRVVLPAGYQDVDPARIDILPGLLDDLRRLDAARGGRRVSHRQRICESVLRQFIQTEINLDKGMDDCSDIDHVDDRFEPTDSDDDNGRCRRVLLSDDDSQDETADVPVVVDVPLADRTVNAAAGDGNIAAGDDDGLAPLNDGGAGIDSDSEYDGDDDGDGYDDDDDDDDDGYDDDDDEDDEDEDDEGDEQVAVLDDFDGHNHVIEEYVDIDGDGDGNNDGEYAGDDAERHLQAAADDSDDEMIDVSVVVDFDHATRAVGIADAASSNGNVAAGVVAAASDNNDDGGDIADGYGSDDLIHEYRPDSDDDDDDDDYVDVVGDNFALIGAGDGSDRAPIVAGPDAADAVVDAGDVGDRSRHPEGNDFMDEDHGGDDLREIH